MEDSIFDRCLEIEARKSQDVANVVWALCRVGRRIPKGLLEALEGRELTTTELVACLWALAEARNATSGLWASAERRLSDRQLAAVLCAHAAAQVAPAWCLVRPEVATFSAPALAKSLWAWAKLRVAISSEAIRRCQELLDSFKASEFASSVWAIGSMESPAVDFFEALELRRDLESHHLSQLCWALGSAGVRRPTLMKQVAQELLTRHDLSLQSVANICWAFRTLEISEDGRLTLHLQSLVAQHLVRASCEDVESLLGILWASEDEALRAAISSTLGRLGRQMDKLRETSPLPELPVAYEVPGILVLFKPAGWEVDTFYCPSKENSFEKGSKVLRFFLMAQGARGSGFSGFISRLDAPSSGLLLLATSFEALFWLQAQREMKLLERDYVALCRGWLEESSCELRWRLRRQGKGVRVSEHGRPALTKARGKEIQVASHIAT